MTCAASRLLDAVDRTPDVVETEATALAERSVADGDHRTAAAAWRAAGIARRMLGRIIDALTAFDAGIAAAEHADDHRLAALIRTSRAAPRFMTGDMDGGLDDLRLALATLDGADRGIAVFQHAQYLDVVEDPGATAAFDEAVSLLTGSDAHAKYLGHALANRGLHHANAGRPEAARRDLTAALAIWDELDLAALAATVVHNLGVVSMLSGDFVAALEHFESAQRRTSTLGNDAAASGRDYCDALLSVGLAAEAHERATELAARGDAAGDALAAAELRLLASHAALQLDDVDAAVATAERALAGFRAAGRPGWEAMARLSLARADVARGGGDSASLELLAADLLAHRWHDAALDAALLAADADTAAGRFIDARRRIDEQEGPVRAARAERRLQACTIAAAVAAAEGDGAGARRSVRRGLAIVEQEQRSVGAIDARAHFARHAARLLTIGREQAIERRDGRSAWAELERMRGLSLRHPRVRPVDDPELGALLGRLRQVSVDLAATEPGDDGWDALAREQRALQRRVADHVRRTPGAADAVDVVDLDAVRARLDGGAMVTYEPIGGRLWAFVLDDRLRRVDCGDLGGFTDRVAAVQAATRRLARRTAHAHTVALAVSQLAELAGWFDANLALPVERDRPLAIVVPGELASVPWSSLPRLAGRPVSLAPSAWAWSAAMGVATPPASEHAVFVAGPGLPAAAAEVEAAAAAHARSEVLVGAAATSARTSDEIERSTVAHIAAHYAPRRGNPLFSRFELADGPWFLHDLVRSSRVPATWVVPSCESAVGDVPVAGELLGLTSVLLAAGARSVVLSSGLVPDDDVTVAAMTALHVRLAGGTSPATALAEVLETVLAGADDDPAAVVLRSTLACHGGW